MIFRQWWYTTSIASAVLVEPRFLVLPVIALLLVVPLVLPVVIHAFHTDLQILQSIKSNIGKRDTLII